MDPWSKVDYSRIIREASMVEQKLPEFNPHSGRVPGRGLLALPILEARQRRNRGEIAKKGYVFGRITSRRINRRRGTARGATRCPGSLPARPNPRPRHLAACAPGEAPLALLRDSGSFRHA